LLLSEQHPRFGPGQRAERVAGTTVSEGRSGGADGWDAEIRGRGSRMFRGHAARWWVGTVGIISCLVFGIALFFGTVLLDG